MFQSLLLVITLDSLVGPDTNSLDSLLHQLGNSLVDVTVLSGQDSDVLLKVEEAHFRQLEELLAVLLQVSVQAQHLGEVGIFLRGLGIDGILGFELHTHSLLRLLTGCVLFGLLASCLFFGLLSSYNLYSEYLITKLLGSFRSIEFILELLSHHCVGDLLLLDQNLRVSWRDVVDLKRALLDNLRLRDIVSSHLERFLHVVVVFELANKHRSLVDGLVRILAVEAIVEQGGLFSLGLDNLQVQVDLVTKALLIAQPIGDEVLASGARGLEVA